MAVCAPSLNQISRMKLKNTTETSVLVGVYVVFQLAVLGSLLNTYSDSPSQQHESCGNGISWVPLHVYLSAFVSLSTLLALASAFITETHLDFTQRRQILLQNSSGTLISTNDEGIASGRSPGSGSLSYKDYFSPYRVALCVYVLVSFVHLFNTSRRLFC